MRTKIVSRCLIVGVVSLLLVAAVSLYPSRVLKGYKLTELSAIKSVEGQQDYRTRVASGLGEIVKNGNDIATESFAQIVSDRSGYQLSAEAKTKLNNLAH